MKLNGGKEKTSRFRVKPGMTYVCHSGLRAGIHRSSRGMTIFLVLILSLCCPLFAEEPESLSQHEKVHKRIEELKALKEKDPEAFHRIIEQKRAGIRQRLETLKQNDPEKYQQFLDKRQNFRKQRLSYFKERHPDTYNRFMEHRRNRIKKMETNNPQGFREYLERHPRARERYEKLDRPRFKERRNEFRRRHQGSPREGQVWEKRQRQ